MQISLTKLAPGMARQIARLEEAIAGGMPRRGWKVGIHAPEVLRRLDLSHPAVGWLDGHRVLPSGARLVTTPEARLHVEPEVALCFARAVPPGCAPEEARACIESLRPALEIVDYARPTAGLDDLIAHCMFHEATVLGEPAPPGTEPELGAALPRLRVGDAQPMDPTAGLVMSDLGAIAAFVAAYLAEIGCAIEAGDIVLSGSFVAAPPPVPVAGRVTADFGRLGIVHMEAAPA